MNLAGGLLHSTFNLHIPHSSEEDQGGKNLFGAFPRFICFNIQESNQMFLF